MSGVSRSGEREKRGVLSSLFFVSLVPGGTLALLSFLLLQAESDPDEGTAALVGLLTAVSIILAIPVTAIVALFTRRKPLFWMALLGFLITAATPFVLILWMMTLHGPG